MLRLLLKITVAWFSLSLLCSVVWVLLIELALRRKARRAPAVIGTSTQTLCEEKVDALLTTQAASNPIGTQTTQASAPGNRRVAKINS
jgi:hypothetical protein